MKSHLSNSLLLFCLNVYHLWDGTFFFNIFLRLVSKWQTKVSIRCIYTLFFCLCRSWAVCILFCMSMDGMTFIYGISAHQRRRQCLSCYTFNFLSFDNNKKAKESFVTVKRGKSCIKSGATYVPYGNTHKKRMSK